MGTVFFQDANRKDAGAFGLFDGLAKVSGGEFFPADTELLLCRDGSRK